MAAGRSWPVLLPALPAASGSRLFASRVGRLGIPIPFSVRAHVACERVGSPAWSARPRPLPIGSRTAPRPAPAAESRIARTRLRARRPTRSGDCCRIEWPALHEASMVPSRMRYGEAAHAQVGRPVRSGRMGLKCRRPSARPRHSVGSRGRTSIGRGPRLPARVRTNGASNCQNHCQNPFFGSVPLCVIAIYLMGPTSLDSGAAHRGPAWSGGRSAASAPSGSFRCPPVPRYRLPGNGLPCSFWPSRPDGTVHQTRRPRPDARSRNSLGRSFLCDGREVCLRTYYLRLRSARMRARGRKRIECRKFGI